MACVAETKRGEGGEKASKRGIGKGASAIRAGVFGFLPLFSQPIRYCQLSIRDLSQVEV